jgi:hypothetical protein
LPTSSESLPVGQKNSRLPAGLLALCALTWSLGWLARYPGVMSPDSLDQWQQLISGRYNDWHPVASTLFMKFAASVWPSPAAVVLLQLVLMLALVAAVLGLAVRRQVPRRGIIALGLAFALLPANGAMLACLWKDIPFGISFGAFTLMLVWLTAQPHGPLGTVPALVLLALALTASLLRHNGLPAVFAGLGALALAQPARRGRLVQLLVALVLGFTAWQWGVRNLLHAPGAPAVEMLGSQPLQQVATIVANHPDAITSSKRRRLEAVVPWSAWLQHTSRVDVEDLKFHPAFDSAPIRRDPGGYFRLWWELVSSHPGLALRAALRQSGVIWNPIFFARDTYPTGIVPNDLGLQPAPPWPALSAALERGDTVLRRWPLQVLVSPACVHFILLAAGVWGAVSTGWTAVVPFVPAFVLVALYALILPVPDFRYFFPVFVALPILLLHVALRRAPTPVSSSHA